MTDKPAHSYIGASQVYRFSVCPGSVREIKKYPKRKSSIYADEGTAAHALASHCVQFKLDPVEFQGWAIDIGDHERPRLIEPPHGFDGDTDTVFLVTEEMVDAVAMYQDVVSLYNLPGCTMYVEEEVDLSMIHPDAFGRVDVGVFDPAAMELTTIDFKYGIGIVLPAKGNKQLMYYALALVRKLQQPIRKVRLIIVQPRADHEDGPVREVEIDILDLLDYETELRQYIASTMDPNAPLVPGGHCRFCDAAWGCEALEAAENEVALATFSPVVSYEPAKLADILEKVPGVEARCKAIREFAYSEAVKGAHVPRHKLVSKKKHRRWNDADEVTVALTDLGAKPADIYAPGKLKSPTQMEKVVNKKVLAPFIITESSGTVLVPDSDKRSAITPPRQSLPFTPVKEEQ